MMTVRLYALIGALALAYAHPARSENVPPAGVANEPSVALSSVTGDEPTRAAVAESAVAPEPAPKTVTAAAEAADREEQKAEINSKVRNPTLQKHLLENIDVFGKSEMPAIYILGPGIEEFEGQLLTRDFSRDPFFMQNIDREEFEMKMWLRGDLDEDKKKDEKEAR